MGEQVTFQQALDLYNAEYERTKEAMERRASVQREWLRRETLVFGFCFGFTVAFPAGFLLAWGTM